jgi:hypothetical protein
MAKVEIQQSLVEEASHRMNAVGNHQQQWLTMGGVVARCDKFSPINTANADHSSGSNPGPSCVETEFFAEASWSSLSVFYQQTPYSASLNITTGSENNESSTERKHVSVSSVTESQGTITDGDGRSGFPTRRRGHPPMSESISKGEKKNKGGSAGLAKSVLHPCPRVHYDLLSCCEMLYMDA